MFPPTSWLELGAREETACLLAAAFRRARTRTLDAVELLGASSCTFGSLELDSPSARGSASCTLGFQPRGLAFVVPVWLSPSSSWNVF